MHNFIDLDLLWLLSQYSFVTVFFFSSRFQASVLLTQVFFQAISRTLFENPLDKMSQMASVSGIAYLVVSKRGVRMAISSLLIAVGSFTHR